MNKLFIFDLDGTLLNSKNEITEESKKAIWKCKEKGDYIAYITGRGIIKILKNMIFCNLKSQVQMN